MYREMGGWGCELADERLGQSWQLLLEKCREILKGLRRRQDAVWLCQRRCLGFNG